MRTVSVALTALLTIAIGWYVWQTRDARSSGQVQTLPTAVQATSTTQSTPSGALAARKDVRNVSSGAREKQKKDSQDSEEEAHWTEAYGEQTVAAAAAPAPNRVDRNESSVITSELPSYLAFFASQPEAEPPSNGCKDPFELMAEMSRGSREESWAPQMEKALQGLVERHPLGFPVSITCRAAICQITDIGPVTDVLKNEAQYNAYWGNFEQKLQSAPSSAEFATTSYFTAQAPEDPSQNISGYVLTTIDRVAPSESQNCARFKPRSGGIE